MTIAGHADQHKGIAGSLNLNEIVDGQRLGPASIPFVVMAVLIMISDGFDLSAMGYIAPELAKQWGLKPVAFVPAFSAGIIGMMIGGPLLGYLGDRHGRKRLVIAGMVMIGVFTLLTVAVRSPTDLVVLRFLTGIGLGGVIPNAAALVAEIMPRRIRGRMLVIITLGIPIGISLPGLVAATLVPVFGWKAILLIGGILPLVVAAGSMFFLPESVKYLMARGDRDIAVRRIVRRLRPDLQLADHSRIVLPPSDIGARRGAFRDMFAGDFAVVTPLLWVCQAANQMANFFALTWLPTLLQASGASTAHAGASASLFSLGGLLSGLMLLLILDRVGIIPVVLLFLLGAPLVACMALTDLPPEMHVAIIVGAGACVTGVQIGLTALLGLFYPTAIRSTGTGWTQAAGRVGALAAPVVGGILLGFDIPMHSLPLAPAMLMAAGTVACAFLAWRCVRRFGGVHPGEFSVAPSRAGAETSLI